MRKVQIGKFEFYSLIVLYLTSSDKIWGYYYRTLKQDSLITLLLALVASLILVSIYYLLVKRVNYVSFDKLVRQLLGNGLGKILLIMYSLYFVFLALTDLKDITHLNHVYLLPDTKIMIIAFILLLPVYISLILGVEASSRIANLLFFVIVAVFIVFSILLLISNKVQYDNIFPFFEVDKKEILKHTIYSTYSVPYGEIFVFIIFYKYLKNNKSSIKITLLTQVTMAILVLAITFWNITVLGPIAMQYTHTPSVLISKRIDIQEFIQRFDIIVIMVLVLSSYVKQYVLLYAASYCTKHVFRNIKFRIIATTFTFMTLIGSVYFLRQYLLYLEFRFNQFIPYVSPIFEVFIPVTLLFLTLFRGGSNNTSKKKIVKSDSAIEIQ